VAGPLGQRGGFRAQSLCVEDGSTDAMLAAAAPRRAADNQAQTLHDMNRGRCALWRRGRPWCWAIPSVARQAQYPSRQHIETTA
jgi:hypothetical protein